MNKLTTAVWEITMGCNMRCKHCGSSCAEALPDELNTSEALEVCDQLKDLGLHYLEGNLRHVVTGILLRKD
jgi:MoaA/NifB/PqqE/SkfB family radical SAM enzyme